MIEKSIWDSIWDSQNIIISGKWGVGKSTISAAIALKYSEKWEKTIAIDMDAAHSLADSLGYNIWKIPEWTTNLQHTDNLTLYFLGTIIPSFFPWETFESLLKSGVDFDQLNHYLDSLVDKKDSFFSLMRMGTYDNFVSIAKDHENVAYILQLLDLFEKWILYQIHGTQIRSRYIETSDSRIIIDSENTKWLLRVLKGLISVKTSISNMHKAFHGSLIQQAWKVVTKQAIKWQDTLLKFAQWDIVENPEEYIDESIHFIQSVIHAKIVIVTAPWYNEINQTITEIQQLIDLGIPPSHILVNKYKDHYDKDPEMTSEAYKHLCESIPQENIGITKVKSDFKMTDPRDYENIKKKNTSNNLRKIAESI